MRQGYPPTGASTKSFSTEYDSSSWRTNSRTSDGEADDELAVPDAYYVCSGPLPMTIRAPPSLGGQGVVVPASPAGGVGPGRLL